MMTMMMKTIVLSLSVLASVVVAIEDNVVEFGRFRVLKEKSWSGWMQNKKITRRDHVLLQTTKQSVDDLSLDYFPLLYTSVSMSMSMKVLSASPSEAPVVSPPPTATPTPAPTTMAPTGSPSVSPGPTRSSQPSVAPSVSPGPTSSSAPSVAPSVSPGPTGWSGPSVAPSISPGPTSSSSPSVAPSVSPGPSMSFSAAPSVSPGPSVSHQPSAVPSISSAPTTSSAPTSPPTPAPSSPPTSPVTGGSTPTLFQEGVIFTCTDNGVDLIEPPFQTTTAIDIQVVYVVETFAILDDYEDDLQNEILALAVIGALQCNTGGPLFGPGGNMPTISMATIPTGEACTTVAENAICIVFETSFQIIVEEDFDPAVASLLAYVFIREEMSSGAFVEAIPLLDRVEYLRPVLPELLPIETPEIPNIDLDAARQGSITVSPWTIGAVLAMCFGGVMALWVWTRNRSTRHRRHVQLLEDMSLTLPSAPHEATTP